MHWTVYLEGGPERVNHAAAAVGNLIYSFGGYNSSNVSHFQSFDPIDVHVFNTITLKWKLLKTTNAHCNLQGNKADCPFQRYGHTVVAFNNNIYLWGGRNDSTSCNTLFCFDTDTHTWSCPQTFGTTPPARDGHSASLINSKMFIFGGFEDEFERYSQDVYALDLKTMQWSYIVIQGECPVYRDFHSGSAVGDRMYVFGGRSDRYGAHSFDGEMYPNTIVYLDTSSMRWVTPQVTGTPPIGRRSHSAFVYKGKLYLFGGYNGLEDMHYNDLHEFCPVQNEWRKVETVGEPPAPRRRHVALVIHQQMFLFGGTSPCIASTEVDSESRISIDPTLKDHDDLYILDLSPSLKTLCILAIRNYNIIPTNIPAELKWEYDITTRKVPQHAHTQNSIFIL